MSLNERLTTAKKLNVGFLMNASDYERLTTLKLKYGCSIPKLVTALVNQAYEAENGLQ